MTSRARWSPGSAAAECGGRSAWHGWRAVAEQQVRDGDLDEAVAAYREADRRAPPASAARSPTASPGCSRRPVTTSPRGANSTAPVAPTRPTRHTSRGRSSRSTSGLRGRRPDGRVQPRPLRRGGGGGGGPQRGAAAPARQSSGGVICADGVAAGEWWRILTSAFLHLGLLHIAFNMYVLYLFGPIVEQMYGHVEYSSSTCCAPRAAAC